MEPENIRQEFFDKIDCSQIGDVENAAAQIYENLCGLTREDSLLALFLSTCHYALKLEKDGDTDADATVEEITEVLPHWLRHTRRECSVPAD